MLYLNATIFIMTELQVADSLVLHVMSACYSSVNCGTQHRVTSRLLSSTYYIFLGNIPITALQTSFLTTNTAHVKHTHLFNHQSLSIFNPLRTKLYLSDLKTQLEPRSHCNWISIHKTPNFTAAMETIITGKIL